MLMPRVWSVGKPPSLVDAKLAELRKDLFVADRRAFESRAASWREFLRKRPDCTMVYSDEAISTGAQSLARMRLPAGHALDRVEIAQRLCDVLPNPRVLIVIREQKSFLSSFYLQLQKEGLEFGPFDDWLRGEWDRKEYASVVRAADYSDLVDLWDGLVGAENVFVSCFEFLSVDRARFFADIGRATALSPSQVAHAFEQVRVNDRTSRAEIAIRRFLRRFPVHAPIRPLLRSDIARAAVRAVFSGAARQSADMSNLWIQKCDNYYASSNARLGERIGVDLAGLGYSM